jgi:hypothetical protein
MRVVGGGQPGSDVQELADARGAQLVHTGDQEAPQHLGDNRQRRHRLKHLLPGLTVSAEVVLAADPVVPHAGRVRHARIKSGQLAAALRGRPR